MYKKQCRLIAKKEGRIDLEAGPQYKQEVSKNESKVAVASTVDELMGGESRDGSEIELTEQSMI